MIKYVDEPLINDLKYMCVSPNIYACRIECLFDSYGLNFDNIQFWIQYNNGAPCSAISKSGADATVLLTEKSDISEIASFLNIIGFGSVLSEKIIFDDIPYNKGITMSLCEIQTNTAPLTENYKIIYYPDLNEVYRILCRCREIGFDVPQYEDFILDVSHRLRHGTAKCAAVSNGEKYISFAMTVAQSESCATIGAVATEKEYRRMGIGSMCVRALCRSLGERKIFIMRDKSKNEKFYGKLGFENTGKFYVHIKP